VASFPVRPFAPKIRRCIAVSDIRDDISVQKVFERGGSGEAISLVVELSGKLKVWIANTLLSCFECVTAIVVLEQFL
jgi:hypothetical protein